MVNSGVMKTRRSKSEDLTDAGERIAGGQGPMAGGKPIRAGVLGRSPQQILQFMAESDNLLTKQQQ